MNSSDQRMESHLDLYRRWGELARPYFQWQFDQFSPYLGSRVADVGCGLGNFTPFLKDKSCYVAFEPDQELAREFQSLHQSDNIHLAKNPDITNPASVEEMQQYGIDSILCVNVLEHIENDQLAMKNLVSSVSAGGRVCLLVPALQFLYG